MDLLRGPVLESGVPTLRIVPEFDVPHNVPARVLLAQTLVTMKRIQPSIMPEFREKLAMLQKEKPLPEPAHSVVQRIIDEAVGA